ncbi:unnamed protein product [Caenorhabditis angaria]|uniref:Uncharacterized protein n=1 Tax=Caenorhabditis angaria TaxID=860376 RepID=A0A9P1IWL8_9PELO|nr:unnamed protein product [Caenorhabditis angaria]
MPLRKNANFILIFFAIPTILCQKDVLEIRTTYQAEDIGLLTDQHPQCQAWKLFEKTQVSRVSLTVQDVKNLALRRDEVYIRDEKEADKYLVPRDLLANYTIIRVNFRNICRLLPRVLQISSPLAAQKSRINLGAFCQNFNYTMIDPELEKLEINITNLEDAQSFSIGMPPHLLQDHLSITITMPGACDASGNDENEIAMQYYIEKYGDFSFDISRLNVPVDKLHETVHDMKALDQIMRPSGEISFQRPLPSSTILPFLKRVNYDAHQPPNLHLDDVVTVKVGLWIQFMSNFELSTMDYDIDTWIRMAWVDPRLRHDLSRPIMVNDYKFLRMIWRPDPIFKNSKHSTFHKVSYLNFYMFIFPDGKVFMDVRVFLKPTAATIVLCKYPHDNPAVSLKISSMGFTDNVIRFEWFNDLDDAIKVEKSLRIPELSIRHVSPETCNGSRKSGSFSCLEAKFFMHREVGYHIANTYVPTTLCVIFSWIAVWLPEEFVEGRIFVSLTVFLTLSAENSSAKDELPKVSYVKSIDIWFGFTSIFVFLTMIQSLVVIYLGQLSKNQRKKLEKNLDCYGKYQITKTLLRSRFYHKLSMQIDSFCKVMYPVVFIIFLTFYSFVITQGEEDKCIQ